CIGTGFDRFRKQHFLDDRQVIRNALAPRLALSPCGAWCGLLRCVALRKGGQGFSRRFAKQQFELGRIERLAALAEELAQHQVELLPEQLVLALKERDAVDKMLLPFRCHSDDTIYDECRIQGKPDHSRSYQ